MSLRYVRPLMTLALLAVPAAPLAGQTTRRFLVEGRGGVSVPSGAFADAENAGYTLGTGVGYLFARRWWAHLDYDFIRESGRFDYIHAVNNPTYGIHSVMGKLGYEVPLEPALAVEFNLGGGVSNFRPSGQSSLSSQTYLGMTGGARIRLLADHRLNLVMSPEVNVAFADRAKLGERRAVMWPFSVGLQYRL